MAESSENLVRIADVARELGLSPSRIRQLADADVIPSSRTPGGHRLFDLRAVRAAIVRRTLPEDPLTVAVEAAPSWQYELTLLGLSEDIVWRRVAEDLDLDRESPAGKIMGYAFTEMLNNAIDHSASETATITWWVGTDQWSYRQAAAHRRRDLLHLKGCRHLPPDVVGRAVDSRQPPPRHRAWRRAGKRWDICCVPGRPAD